MSKVEARHTPRTSHDIVFTFNDEVTYCFPEMILHYLDDREVHGWTWKPEQDFINRIMQGGDVFFQKFEPYEPWHRYEYIKKVRYIGYLADYGDDIIVENGKPVELGELPVEFLDQMKFLHQAAWNHENRKGPAKIILLPALEFKYSIPASTDPVLCPRSTSKRSASRKKISSQ